MTDLESPKKNNDCYFYYYSTCAKGDNCTFRHEPSALGCETMCSFWKEGKCLNVHCNFRHMELRKNRKVIPCYWESQPVGCLKAHCPFLHQNPRPSDEVCVEKSNISADKSNNGDDSSERKVTAVDSLVVNFEEESDGESMPTYSPLKSGNRVVKVKSLEEIKLEKIQAESAAFYSYSGEDMHLHSSNRDGHDLRQRIVRRIFSKQQSPQRTVTVTPYSEDRVQTNKRLSNDELANILDDESLRKKQKIIHQGNNGNVQITLSKSVSEVSHNDYQEPKLKRSIPCEKPNVVIPDIKIKTLAEIRAERNARRSFPDTQKKKRTELEEQEEAEVSSTSPDENIQGIINEDKNKIQVNIGLKRKIKLRRKLNINEDSVVSSNDKDENITSSHRTMAPKNYPKTEPVENELVEGQSKRIYNKYLTKASISDSDKMEEDVLLLDDDEEEYEEVSLKAEDELLNEISSFIDN